MMNKWQKVNEPKSEPFFEIPDVNEVNEEKILLDHDIMRQYLKEHDEEVQHNESIVSAATETSSKSIK